MGPSTEVKILGESATGLRIGGYGVVFGGQDVTGDYFDRSTDFWPDDSSKTPPVLYQHGQDSALKRARVGKVESVTADDTGLWVEAQLNASSKYLDAIRDLVSKGVLGWSSGSVGHLVDRMRGTGGRKMITSWPIYEFSLTPTPAEPRTIGVRAIKSLGLDFPVDDYEVEEESQATKGGPALEEHAPPAEEPAVEGPQDGAAAKIWEVGTKLRELALRQADDRVAMERFGWDTKDGHRFHDGTLEALEALIAEQKHLAQWARSISEGEDGHRRVNYYKHRLAMINLEASA